MKTEILKMLKETPDFLSGQQLCEGLGVSRTAVWKAIRQLEEEGYAIEAVRNRGYRLVASPDVITAPELKTVLSTVWLGSQVNCFYETDSTNRQARKLAEEGAPHGTLVAADSQSAGKGRRGRAWASPRGVGVWMSFILRLSCLRQKLYADAGGRDGSGGRDPADFGSVPSDQVAK